MYGSRALMLTFYDIKNCDLLPMSLPVEIFFELFNPLEALFIVCDKFSG